MNKLETDRDGERGLVEKIRDWICEIQRERILQAYPEYEDPALKKFFFDNLYPTREQWAVYEKRNRAFIRMTKNVLFRICMGSSIVKALDTIVELNNLTEKLDERVALYLADKCRSAKDATEAFCRDLYREAFTTATAYKERIFQLELLLRSFRFMIDLVRNRRYASFEALLERVPKVFVNNIDLLNFALEGYRAFKVLDDHLDDLYRIVSQRETEHLQAAFEISQG